MSSRESERVHVMKENFMRLHQAGYSIPEVAEMYNLASTTVYQHLGEIALANNVTRSSLLQVLRTPSERAYRDERARVSTSISEFQSKYAQLSDGLQGMMDTLGNILKEDAYYGIH